MLDSKLDSKLFTIHGGRYSLYEVGSQAGNKLAVSPQHFRNLTGIYELAAKMFSIYEIDKLLITHYNHPK